MMLFVQVSLWCAPSMDSPCGAVVAGREADELVAAGTLQIHGDLAARMLRGERVVAPVPMGGSHGLDVHGGAKGSSMRDGGASGVLSSLGLGLGVEGMSPSPMFGLSSEEVLLELSLVDASFTLPRDAFSECWLHT